MNNKLTHRALYALLPVALFVGTWLMWWLWCPEMMNYQEQYQLFLWTGSYFAHSMSMVGGLADYASEFLVQFYYVPWIGALTIAVVITLLQVLSGAISLGNCHDSRLKLTLWIISLGVSIFVLHFMSDENALLSYPVALLLTCLATWGMQKLPKCSALAFGLILVFGYAALYWCVGPVAMLFLIISIVQRQELRLKLAWLLGGVLLACAFTKVLCLTLFTQYPESQLFLGINYYRVENVHPTVMIYPPLAILLLALIPLFNGAKAYRYKGFVLRCRSFFLLVGGAALIAVGYKDEKREIMCYDMLVRQGRWLDIIDIAEKEKPTNDFCLQAVNLALAKTGQLGEKMFEFPQHGMGSLLSKYYRDNTSCLVSAEVFYHLGMVNSAFRYNFDLQESIMNNRKSGRFMKRMAECLIINGKYKAAKKYIDMLSHSLYYSNWAREVKAIIGNEQAIDNHSDYGEMRRLRFKQELLYDYGNLDKIFGLLALESNGHNRLAWEYFNAAMLLKGDLSTFTGMYHYAQEMFRQAETPLHHQEAIAMFWTFGHQSFEGLPYPVSDGVKQRISAFAQVYAENPNNPKAWMSQFGNTYWAYFILNRQAQQPETLTSTEREG